MALNTDPDTQPKEIKIYIYMCVCKRKSLPNLRLLTDELFHQVPALRRVDDDDLDAALPQVRLASQEGFVLADDNTRDAVQ